MGTEEFAFLSHKAVEQIWTWADTIRLVFDTGERPEPTTYVDVRPPSYLHRRGSELPLDLVRDPVQTGAILALLNDQVLGARSEDGVLSVTFESGALLRLLPSQQYESWTVVGAGRVYQCLPGGDVDSW